MRAKDFENVGHGVFRKSLHGMQGSPEKQSFEISELTPPLCAPWPLPEGEARSPGMLAAGEAREEPLVHSRELI